MQNAMLLATLQIVCVLLDLQEILSPSVLSNKFLWLKKDQLHVYQPHVDQMQSVESRMELVHVAASQIMWEIHMSLVVQNVF